MPWLAAAPYLAAGGMALAGGIAGAMSSKGGSSDTQYEWSDEQKNNYYMAQPWAQQQAGTAAGPIPQMGAPPSIYDIPSGQGLQPTSGWYDSIAPEVRQGLWEPWNDAANQMQMNMGGRGQLGSPGAGYSGAAGTGLGQLYADAGQQVGMQAWNMMQPGQQAMWQANLATFQKRVILICPPDIFFSIKSLITFLITLLDEGKTNRKPTISVIIPGVKRKAPATRTMAPSKISSAGRAPLARFS
jgi:hypothetical protein